MKRAIPIAQQRAHVSGVPYYQIRNAVAIQISDRERDGACAGGRVQGGLEGAVAVLLEHAHGRAVLIDNGEIRAAISVKVARDHRRGAWQRVGAKVEGRGSKCKRGDQDAEGVRFGCLHGYSFGLAQTSAGTG